MLQTPTRTRSYRVILNSLIHQDTSHSVDARLFHPTKTPKLAQNPLETFDVDRGVARQHYPGFIPQNSLSSADDRNVFTFSGDI